MFISLAVSQEYSCHVHVVPKPFLTEDSKAAPLWENMYFLSVVYVQRTTQSQQDRGNTFDDEGELVDKFFNASGNFWMCENLTLVEKGLKRYVTLFLSSHHLSLVCTLDFIFDSFSY